MLKTALKKAGFGCQLRIRSLLMPPKSCRTKGSYDVTTWDFFQDGRLAILADSREAALKMGNKFMQKAELCETQIMHGCIGLADLPDMHNFNEDFDNSLRAEQKSAQRGPAWNMGILKGLLNSSPTSDDGPSIPWPTVHDQVDVLDLHPYVGDAAMATLKAMRNNVVFVAPLRHFLAKMGYKYMKDHGPFAEKRLRVQLEQDWCQNIAPLYKFTDGCDLSCFLNTHYK